MTEYALLGLASIIVLGIIAQWLAWRFKIPSILLLLIFGLVAGPVTGMLNPGELLGNLLFPFLSLAVGVLLFEGGLSLRVADIDSHGRAVRNLITVGLLLTWVLTSVAAFYILQINVGLAILIGAVLVVTGPTVVTPLLRLVRPKGRIGAIGKTEAIMNDPIGAVLAVLVLETVVFINEPIVAGLEASSFGEATYHAVQGLFLLFFVSLGVSVAGAGLLVMLLQRRLVPEHLKSAVTLTVVVGAFAVSEILQAESGVLAATLMGIAVANQRFVAVRRLIQFKEGFRIMLIAVLFILLASRLSLAELRYVNQNTLLFLAVLVLVVRPLAVLVSSIGARLNWREMVLLSWMAPRGIVAAALISLFSFRLDDLFPGESESLVPVVFVVIMGTVAIYGLTITPIARWLGLAHSNPQGVLFVGAQSWVRRMAKVLQEQGIRVVLLDSDPKNVAHAQQAGLDAHHAPVLSDVDMDAFELGEIGRLIVITPNEEVNARATLNFYEYFDTSSVYQLPVRSEAQVEDDGPAVEYLRAQHLFGGEVTYAVLNRRFIGGAAIKTGKLSDEFSFEDFEARYGDTATPLFLVRENGDLHVFTATGPTVNPAPGETLIALIDRVDKATEEESEGLPVLSEISTVPDRPVIRP